MRSGGAETCVSAYLERRITFDVLACISVENTARACGQPVC